MFKVHVIDARNQGRYQAALEQHHRIRHDIYVGERRWTALARADGREVDQFDTLAATYLLGIDPITGVVAGSRLVPTLRPHLMSEIFPELAAVRGVPRGPDIHEWTRIFVVPSWRERGHLCRAAGVMYAALLEFALTRGLRQLSVVCEAYWIERLATLDWRPRPLGEPLVVDGLSVVGITVEMTAQALATTRAHYGLRTSVLFDADGPTAGGEARLAQDRRRNGQSRLRRAGSVSATAHVAATAP